MAGVEPATSCLEGKRSVVSSDPVGVMAITGAGGAVVGAVLGCLAMLGVRRIWRRSSRGSMGKHCQVRAKTTRMVNADFFVATDGERVTAGFRAMRSGVRDELPDSGGMAVLRSEQTPLLVKDISFAVDAMPVGSGDGSSVALWSRAFTALMAGALEIDTIPLMQRLPVARLRMNRGVTPTAGVVLAQPESKGNGRHRNRRVYRHLFVPAQCEVGVYLRVPERKVAAELAPAQAANLPAFSLGHGLPAGSAVVLTGVVTLVLAEVGDLGSAAVAAATEGE